MKEWFKLLMIGDQLVDHSPFILTGDRVRSLPARRWLTNRTTSSLRSCSLFHGNLLPEYITMKCNLKRVLPFPKRRSKIQNVVVMQNVVVVLDCMTIPSNNFCVASATSSTARSNTKVVGWYRHTI